MGEMADWIIECYELKDFYDEIIDPEDFGSIEKQCKYCKETGLRWGMVEGRWRLFNSKGEVHSCNEYKVN